MEELINEIKNHFAAKNPGIRPLVSLKNCPAYSYRETGEYGLAIEYDNKNDIIYEEANQVYLYTKILTTNNGTHTYLLLVCCDEQYRNNYSNMLNEVNSENVGIVSANYIFSRLPKNFLTNHDRKCYQLQTLKSILYANYEVVPKYETIVSPAERIVEAFDDETLAKMNLTIEKYSELISNTDNLTLYKKLMLGLPISYSEYGYANLLIDELTNGIDINAIKKLQKRLY